MLVIALAVGAVLLAAWWTLTQPFVPRRESRAGGADPARLERDVVRVVGFAPRDAAHPASLSRLADELGRALKEAGGAVTELPFTVEGSRFRNVIAGFGPEAGPRVVVGAHYDAYMEFPGADDNASGVAGVLELARLLGRARSLRGRVDLALWPLEEPPHFATETMGSSVHARVLADAGVPVRAMMSLEMIGCFRDEPGSQQLPVSLLKLVYPTTGSFIAVVGRLSETSLVRRVKGAMAAGELQVRSLNAPQGFPAIDLSDHLSFWRAGYPALLVTDTSFYRNPRYHTRQDTPSTLDYRRMALVVDGVFRAVLDLTGSTA